MARGYPDYFGSSVFAGPGTSAISASGLVGVGAGDTETIIDIAGKGTAFGGVLYGNKLQSDALYDFSIWVDSTLIFDCWVTHMRKYGYHSGSGLLLVLSYYDAEQDAFMVKLARDITFGQRFQIYCLNMEAAGVVIQANLWYYNVI